MKKLAAFALAILLPAALLSGCAGSPPAGDATSAGTTPATSAASAAAGSSSGTTAAPPAETRYKISVATPTYAPYDSDAELIVYFTQNSNIDWDMQYVDANKAAEVMNLRFASGDIPDVYANLGYAKFWSLVDEGIGGTIPENTVRKYAPGLAAHLDGLGESAWKAGQYSNGEMFTFPGVNAEYMYGSAIIWRQSWLDKFNAPVPKTLADAEKVFYEFAQKDPDGNGANDTYGLSADGMTQVFYAFGAGTGAKSLDENGKIVYNEVTEGRRDALALLAKWYKDGVLDPEYITGENKGGYWALSHSFCNGRIGFTARGISNHWRPIEWLKTKPQLAPTANQELFAQNFPDETYTYGWPLEGPDGEKANGVTSYAFWSGFAKKLTDDEPRLGAFLQFVDKWGGFNDPEDFLVTKYGIEGKHWDYNDQHIPTMREEYKDAAGEIGNGNVFTFVNNYKAGDLVQPDYAAWREQLYSEPGRSVMLNNYFERPLPSAAEFTEIDKLTSEFEIDVITGRKSIDDWDSYVEQWHKLGGDKKTAEANEIYSGGK